MSLSISGIGAVQPIYPTTPVVAPYAQNADATDSVAGTTSGHEGGAASVVYEPGSTDGGEQYTYSNRGQIMLPPPPTDPQQIDVAGDEAVVAATGGTVAPPPEAPETPHAAQVKQLLNNVWAPVRPLAIDPTASDATAAGPVQPDQAEASAQASYSALADATIAGASISDLHKFG